MPNTGDYEHICQGQEVLKNESVIVYGAWADYTGSDTNVQNALMQGKENNLFGTRADLEGQKFQSRDSRGYPKDRFRTRQHIESIPVDQLKTPGINDSPPDSYKD